MIIKLDAPYKYEDYEVTEFDLDLMGKVNPRTQEYLEGRYRREILRKRKNLSPEEFGVYTEHPAADKQFRLMVFEWLTGYPKELIFNDTFPLATYNAILDAIVYFFMNWSEPSAGPPEAPEEAMETPQAQ